MNYFNQLYLSFINKNKFFGLFKWAKNIFIRNTLTKQNQKIILKYTFI